MGLSIAGLLLPFGCAAVTTVGLSFLIGLHLAQSPVRVRPPRTWLGRDR